MRSFSSDASRYVWPWPFSLAYEDDDYGESGKHGCEQSDGGGPITDFPADHQETVEYLRANGRPILADKLVTMLQDFDGDPDEPEVNIVSLQDMARCLVERGDFADPSIGPGRCSMVYAQWRIMGDGVLVVSFLGDDEILLVAQGDRNGCPVDVSKQGRLQDILKEYECLVPRRH